MYNICFMLFYFEVQMISGTGCVVLCIVKTMGGGSDGGKQKGGTVYSISPHEL